MTLCEICQEVDFLSLIGKCFLYCRERQQKEKQWKETGLEPDVYFSDRDETSPRREPLLRPRQHSDIFHIRESAKEGCGVCGIVLQAFERNGTNEEDARGWQIGFHALGGRIEAYYDLPKEPTKLCTLDAYMRKATIDELFQALQIQEDDSPPVLSMMENNPRSQACLAVASHWLRNCSENHDSCNRLTESQNKPERLIDIGDGSREPSLIDTEPLPGRVRWLSLSYCWGEEPSLKLTRDNIGILRSGIAMDKLDPTIRDAIFITRALEIPYIWVDSLCILQDPGGADWSEQANKMNVIYGGSTVTLVVASSKTVTEGFLNDRQPQYVHITSREASDTTSSLEVYLSPEWVKEEDSADGPWSSRGWTMQEGLLPNRLLYYTSSQMIWRCCEEESFERGVRRSVHDEMDRWSRITGDDDISYGSPWFMELGIFWKFKVFKSYVPYNPGVSSAVDLEVFRSWYEIIEKYSPRRFKDVSDRLVALSGLAREFGSAIQCNEYVAGLWRPDLIRGLMWRTEGAGIAHGFSLTRTANAIFPSWSWASTGDYEPIMVDSKADRLFKSVSRVQKVHIHLVDRGQPFGMVKSGSITIAGPLKRLPILYNKAWRSADEPMSKLQRYISKQLEIGSSGAMDPRFSSPLGGHFAILQMLYTLDSLDLLVLEATGGVTNEVYIYQRVGTLTLRYFCPKDVTPPDTVARIDELRNSLAARLGPPWESGRRYMTHNELVEEIEGDPWDVQTVTIV